MGLKKLIVLLDRPVNYAGETLSGRLVVEVDKPMSIIAIYLKYSGEANVHWTETHSRTVSSTNADGSTSNNSESYTETYSSSEVYLALQQLVFGNDTVECELPEGQHVFVFNCQLPMNLPCSFEGVDGRVRYSIKATIKRSTWKVNHVETYPVTVMPICDLNHIANAGDSVAEQKGKSFWGHSNVLLMIVNLPVRGYVPGQVIPIVVSLRNESGVQVKSISVALVQKVTFHATTKSRSSSSNIFKSKFPVSKGLGSEDIPISFKLPSVPPSYLEFCKIIDINYELHVTAKVKAWYHKNLTMNPEIIVGNIPLTSYEKPIPSQQLLHESSQKEDPSHSQATDHRPPSYGFVVPPGLTYENLPPPSYEQSMRLENTKGENKQSGIVEFAPLYPVYKFESHS